MTPIKQINKHSCVLACIESLSIDKNKHIAQQELINRYPEYCRKGTDLEGAVDLNHIYTVLIDLGFSNPPLLLGEGREFLLSHQANLQYGIFLYTMYSDNGKNNEYHFWRLVQMFPDYVVVIEPLPQYPYPYRQLQWDYLETRGCRAVVCNMK